MTRFLIYERRFNSSFIRAINFFARRVVCVSVDGGVPVTGRGSELGVDFGELFAEILLSGLQARFQCRQIVAGGLCFAQLVERFIQLEDFFEEFGRRLLFVLAFFAHVLEAQEIFDAGDGILQRAVGIVQLRTPAKRQLAFFFRGVDEIVRMELPAKLQVFLLERILFNPQLAREAENGKIVQRRGVRLGCGRRAHLGIDHF